MSPPKTTPARSERLWDYDDVEAHTGLTRMYLYSLKSRGQMPAPVAYDGRRPLWRAAHIRAWHARPRGRRA